MLVLHPKYKPHFSHNSMRKAKKEPFIRQNSMCVMLVPLPPFHLPGPSTEQLCSFIFITEIGLPVDVGIPQKHLHWVSYLNGRTYNVMRFKKSLAKHTVHATYGMYTFSTQNIYFCDTFYSVRWV